MVKVNNFVGGDNPLAFINVDQLVMNPKKDTKGVFLDVHPVTPANLRKKDDRNDKDVVYKTVRPMIILMKIIGILPIEKLATGRFRFSPLMIVYSILFFGSLLAYVIYSQWNSEMLNMSEGKFEEAAIDYLFLTHLVPIVMIPTAWYESGKMAECFNLWADFEKMYKRVNNKKLPLYFGNKSLYIPLAMIVIGFGAMIIIHLTMVEDFRIIQVLPYCIINTVTYAMGGYWYLMCSVIANVSITVSNDFQNILRHVGPSSKVSEYRSLWLRLARITRSTGNAQCYSLILLCLYLFLTITLSIYGFLSQLQSGLSIKDVGLTITAGSGILMLFFLCDQAHYCTQKARDNFQKKLLTVELSWMNDDAQQEISMFIRATEMNSTDLSLGGFFDVNRTLFKSLMATMVTYLVVLLQFQISIPTEKDGYVPLMLNGTDNERISEH